MKGVGNSEQIQVARKADHENVPEDVIHFCRKGLSCTDFIVSLDYQDL